LSLDPYMRGRMNDAKSYAPPQPLDQVMIGGTAGEVVESKHKAFAPGATVVGGGGWQEYFVADATKPGALRLVDAKRVPLQRYLGAAGMPGVTAWYGLNKICRPSAKETVLVSAASGAVGSVVGQLAKRLGCTVVGFAGGPEKCTYVTEELGFDACLDYRAFPTTEALLRALVEVTPRGVDACFENVGGPVLDAAMQRLNAFGRIAFCGTVSGYQGAPIPMRFPQLIVQSRLTLEGFIVSEHLEQWPAALAELTALVATGELKGRESIAEGLEAAPAAFLGLLEGKNFGKQLVKLA
jgi:NADPH-dependent curcumin reductase CurA